MAQACPNVSRPTIKRVLARLREEGSVECICLSVRVANIPCLMCALGYIGACKAREDPAYHQRMKDVTAEQGLRHRLKVPAYASRGTA